MKNSKKTMPKTTTVPKGYRLKPSTHKLIKRVQRLLNMSQDAVISKAVRVFAKGFEKNEKTNNTTII